ncbi:MAG: PAS domain-containing sensor histidine kinase [Alphaproteobacteria bacterium]|nr:PAS domain-containing sensor histidine kinase [Alphaproteobacteria bacterium]
MNTGLEQSEKTTAPPPRTGWLSRNVFLHSRIAIVLILAATLSGAATYAALRETPPFGNDPDTVIWLLNLDLILLLSLVGLIVHRMTGLWSSRKKGIAGSHLHVRLIYIFSILAAAPAIIMTVFSTFFFHFGVQTWFSERVSTAINESQAIAQAYLEEHKQVIRADTLAMANDLNRQAGMLLLNEKAFDNVVRTQSILRNLSEVIIFDKEGRVLVRSGLTFSLEFEEIPHYAIAAANEGDVVVMTGENDDRVRALIKLDSFIDSYLFVGRMVDPQVLSHLDATKRATQDYAALQARYSGLQITVVMIFVVVGLLLLIMAIWFGLVLARQLVAPISALIVTADRVRAGDLSAQVTEQSSIQEFDYLAQSFNRMTRQIQEQQNELILANRQMDRRRRFTETVLAGVTSGVVGVDEKGSINVANTSALEFLGAGENITGRKLVDLVPEVRELLERAHTRPGKITQGEILSAIKDETRRTFLVRIAIELIGDEETGAILTFDDITDLQSAQRKAAWADVARRIAHEIKNPLTPIQLSAERLKKRYLKQIHDDPETFIKCTDTIIKHVGDIGHMVNEFSSFARMPEPVLQRQNLNETIKDALVLHRQAHTQVKIKLRGFESKDIFASIESQLIRQAVNNLVQNAVDSIAIKAGDKNKSETKDGGEATGRINILLGLHNEEEAFLAVSDSGAGFPKNEPLSSLTEPYVTHKQKGTGLGLAIVKKIMEDHNGSVVLGSPDWIKNNKEWEDCGGATVILLLPLEQKAGIDKSGEGVKHG